MTKLSYTTDRSIQERRNWGYWDGMNAEKRRQWPLWNKVSVYRCRHPFDRAYGEAFWAGWYGEDHPNGENDTTRSDRAFIARPSLSQA